MNDESKALLAAAGIDYESSDSVALRLVDAKQQLAESTRILLNQVATMETLRQMEADAAKEGNHEMVRQFAAKREGIYKDAAANSVGIKRLRINIAELTPKDG